jgi:UTP--glucose-1-phosphate uridylyltransferase
MVRKAVIPAAGLGINFLPATKAQSKEMLPIIVTPTIQYVVEEAIDAGIDDILVIIGKGKRAIEDHFDRNYDLELYLENKKKDDQYNEIRRIADMANIHFIRQKEINGLGDAIRYAQQHVGDEPFAVLLGDTIIDSVIPVTQQLIDIYDQYRRTIVAVEAVPKENVSRFGIIGGKQISDVLWSINKLVEKPKIDKTPSNLALAGRYILTPEIFKAIEDTPVDVNQELQLTDALQLMVEREDIYAHVIEGKRYDIGSKLDYLKTIVEFALKKDDLSKEFLKFLKEVVSDE